MVGCPRVYVGTCCTSTSTWSTGFVFLWLLVVSFCTRLPLRDVCIGPLYAGIGVSVHQKWRGSLFRTGLFMENLAFTERARRRASICSPRYLRLCLSGRRLFVGDHGGERAPPWGPPHAFSRTVGLLDFPVAMVYPPPNPSSVTPSSISSGLLAFPRFQGAVGGRFRPSNYSPPAVPFPPATSSQAGDPFSWKE